MRWHLLKTYDKIYTIDLHGNSKKKETAPDGSPDQNVFDIMQGVSINVFVKTNNKHSPSSPSPLERGTGVSEGRGGSLTHSEEVNTEGQSGLAQVFHYDLYGKREAKYDFLLNNSIQSIDFKKLPHKAPMYFMVQKDFEAEEMYNKGFSVNELFPVNNVGIVTSRDSFVIDEAATQLELKIKDFFNLSKEELIQKYNLRENKKWKIDTVKHKIESFNEKFIKPISYRPFDNRFLYYNDFMVERSRTETMQHFLKGENVGLVFCKQFKSGNTYQHTFIANKLIESSYVSNKTSEITSVFPLYLYPEKNEQQIIETTPTPSKGGELGRVPNLNIEIVNQISEQLGLTFVPEKNSPPLEEGWQNSENFDGEVKREYNKISNLPHLKTFRKELRNNLTPAEAKLWTLLKGKQLEGRKFRRQHSVGNYILDFYCSTERLAIELDGQGHFEYSQAEYDRERDLFLSHYGIRVLRFENKWVWDNPKGLLEEVKSYFGKQPLSPTDSSPRLGEQLQEKNSPPDLGGGPEGWEGQNTFAPIDILDYIYAVLHSPTYRDKYKEFLKIDFPRVPYPKDKATFWNLVKLGEEIRQIHLLESPKVEQYITTYPKDGDNTITTKIRQKDWQLFDEKKQLGRIWINETQYFDNVPLVAWEFYIGGYQPAQKWLKDRRGKTLTFEDILHYQKIIVALFQTDMLMRKIDEVEIA